MPIGINASGAHQDVTFDVSDLDRYVDSWTSIDFSQTLSVVGADLMLAVDDTFENSGPGWPALAESTLRKRRGAEAQILVDTGRMRSSVRSETRPDAVEVFTDVEYAVFHVSAEPRTKIPLRDFFALPDEVWEQALKTILDDVIAQHGQGAK